MRSILIAAFLLILPAASLASPVKVSATADDTVSRLVLEFEARPRWQLELLPNGARLLLTSSRIHSFDLSSVFRQIDRDRIADVRVLGSIGIEIDLACVCEVVASNLGDTFLVIDIRDGLAIPPVLHGAVEWRAAPVPDIQRQGETDPVRDAPELGTVPEPDELMLPDLALPLIEIPLILEGLNGSENGSETSARSTALDLMGRALSRAAAQGLVAANPEIQDRSEVVPASPSVALADRTNLSVTTGFDRVVRPIGRAVPPTQTGTVCLSDNEIDVASWGDAKDSLQLGRMRTEAIAEDGSMEQYGALQLARYYIALGFGAEAHAVASMLEPSTERNLVMALSDVMDKGRTDSSVLDGQVYCAGFVALWAILAHPTQIDAAPENPNHILSTFSALPPHLRAHLGPLLSERLHSLGLDGAARTAIKAVTRGGKKTEESTLAIARLDLDGTHAEDARGVLSDLSSGTDLTAAEALLELLEDAENRAMPPNPAWVEDAPTLVGALEGTPVAEKLNLAGLRGLIALGRYDEFRVALVEETPGLTATSRRNLAVLALEIASETADNGQLVKAELGLSNLASPEELDRATRFTLAARLHDLGLSSRAIRYLPTGAKSLEELEVQSDVLAANGRIDTALQMLRASQIDGAEGLLGPTLVSSGQDSEAIEALQASGHIEAAQSAAVRVANWDWLARSEAPGLPEAVGGLKDAGPYASDVSEEEGAEAQNGALIAATRARRAHIDALLNATRVRTDEDVFTN